MKASKTPRGAILAVALSFWGLHADLGSAQAFDAGRSWSVPPDDEILSMVEDRMRENGVGIVIGVIDDGGKRTVTYGKSDAANSRPLDGDTVFQIGSITKTLTSLLLAEMTLRGEVSLDDAASKFLPDGADLPTRGREVTLRDLAMHTSGLPPMPSNIDLRGVPNPYASYTIGDLFAFLSSYDLPRSPGSERAYSNLGVALLGRLLGNRKGLEYELLLKERVLVPLGMADTAVVLNDDQQSRVAPGHGPRLTPVRTWEMAALPASGSLRSTANDTLRLLAAYLGYDESPLREALSFQLNPGDNNEKPLGWGIRDDGVIRHSGGKSGYRAGVAFHPGRGMGAVVLANSRTYDTPMAIAIHLVAGDPLPQATKALERKPTVAVPTDVLDRYEGTYLLPERDALEVARNGNLLVIRYPSFAVLEFAAMGDHEFYYTAGDDEIRFLLGDDGGVTGLALYGDGMDDGDSVNATRLMN